MKKKIILFIIVCIIIIGGVVFLKKDIMDMDPKKLPDVMAFQDEFTRGFMGSTKEVEDGYYLFESGTGGYTMLYPEDARINHLTYERLDDYFEYMSYGGENEKITGSRYTINAIYDRGEKSTSLNGLLGLLSSSVNYEGEYDNIKYDDKEIHFATKEYIAEESNQNAYFFLVVVLSNESDQAVSYVYDISCNAGYKGCFYDMEAVEKEVMKVMESVEFKVE